MTELERQIEERREELNNLFSQEGLNDIVIKKSQELDQLIIKAQRLKMDRELCSKKWTVA